MEQASTIQNLATFREKHNFVISDERKQDLARGQGFEMADFQTTFAYLKLADKGVENIRAAMQARLAIGRGLTLIGPSGAGKTSALLAILNVFREKSFVRYCYSPTEFLKEFRQEDNDLKNATALGIDGLEMLTSGMMSAGEKGKAMAALCEVLESRGKSGRPTYLSVQTISPEDDPFGENEECPPGIPFDAWIKAKREEAFEAKKRKDIELPRAILNRIDNFCPRIKLADKNWWAL